MSLLCFPPSYLFRIPLPVHRGVSFTKHPFLFRSFSCSLSLQSDTRISGWVDQPQAISPVALPTPSTPPVRSLCFLHCPSGLSLCPLSSAPSLPSTLLQAFGGRG